MQALSTAMTVHHEVLRAQLNKYKGVEMQIDGDAVLLGFKDPVSATAWCLATQQVGALCCSVTTCMSMSILRIVLAGPHFKHKMSGSWAGLRLFVCIHVHQLVYA